VDRTSFATVGFDRIEREDCPQAAHLLYKVIASPHQKHSTILITNVDFDAWAQYLGDTPLAMAMLDPLIDGALVLKIRGPSYRASRSGRSATPDGLSLRPSRNLHARTQYKRDVRSET